MLPFIPGGPGFAIVPGSQTAGTVITGLVIPYRAPGGAPLLYDGLTNGRANWLDQPYPHITTLVYTTAGTAHNLYFMRPTNWTTVATAVAKNTTVFNITADPGVYSTNYKYPLPGSATAPVQVADNAIAANDYVAFQYDDGSWQLDKVASVATLAITLTTGTANRTGATVAVGRPFFFFGIKTDSNPATGAVHPTMVTIASTNKSQLIPDTNGGGFPALNPGDPIMLLSDNGTAAGVMDLVAGDYRKF